MTLSRRQALTATLQGSAALLAAQVLRGMGGAVARGQAATPAPPSPVAAMTALPISVEKLTDSVRVISGPGGNMTVILAPGRKTMIDAGLAGRAKDIVQAAVALDNEPVMTLINTHFHFDHVGANALLGEGGAHIVAHSKTRERLSKKQVNSFMGLEFEPAPKPALPIATLDDKLAVFAGDEELRLMHIPGAHTDTDVAIHLPASNVLATGDLWFNGFYPFIDYDAGGSVEGMIAAGKKLTDLANDDTKIVPGHGPVGNKAQWVKFIAMLEEASKRVDAAVAKGMTEQEATSADLLSDLNGDWGKRMFNGNTFVKLLYRGKKKA